MQGKLMPHFVKEKLTETHLLLENQNTNTSTTDVDMFGIAELVAGYMDCIEEAVNYLRDVEKYAEDHPAIIGLKKHLSHYRQQLINDAVQMNNSHTSSRT